MNNLLDTHTLLWFLYGNKHLTNRCRKEIENESKINFISIASFWEIAIKVSLGKLEMNISFQKFYELVEDNGIYLLPITLEDTFLVASLPFHQRDPFDRLINAQGINNKLQILSKDEKFNNYNISTVW